MIAAPACSPRGSRRQSIPTFEQLQDALAAASPRLSPPPTRLASVLIHGTITVLWVLLIARALVGDGLFAWSVGLVYVAYDTVLLGFVFWQTLPLAGGPPAPPPPPRSPPPDLAVIVATHNEAAVLPTTLAALLGQSEPPELIVVADDGSTDGTAALLQEIYGLAAPPVGALSAPSARHPTLRWLRLPRGGKPAALNHAILRIETATVVTVDADTLLDRGAIAAMRAAFAANPDLVAATGILTPVCGATPGGRLLAWFQTYEYMRNFLSRYAWMRMDSLLLISGAFAGYRTSAVRGVGGFDAACLVEDYELVHRLRRYGVKHGLSWSTAVVGGARALTDAPASIPGFLKQRRRWFGGFLQTQFWYRDMIGNPAYGRLGWFMLPVKAADTMQPLYGLTAFVLLLAYVATGRVSTIVPVLGVMGGKLTIDLAFHLWSIAVYRRWTAQPRAGGLAAGLLAALVEPISFQILRHLGAALGWVDALSGRQIWRPQRRTAMLADRGTPARLPRFR